MNNQLKQKWIDALRSDNYKQTQCFLAEKRADGTYAHCCLGVLALVSGKLRSVRQINRCGHSEDIQQFVQIDKQKVDHLVGMNDSESASFAVIAD
jgi:hypothetical protein